MSQDRDTDMDAPQISTLRDDDSPPPAPSPTRTGKFRVKLLVNETKPGTKFITFNGETGEEAAGPSDGPDEEDVPDEDEEDQLIDDDDEPRAGARAKRAQSKGKTLGKRKARPGAPAGKPLMTTFEVDPPESHASRASPSRDASELASAAASPMPQPAPTKRKSVPKGTTPAQRAPRKSKSKTTITIPARAELADLSEGYTGTAPSSPVPATVPPSPSPPEDPGLPPAARTSTPLFSAPMPIYPLPTKPFHVQPPPKIGTGYAPLVPLDRTAKKPRHWRPAHREVRGIAGGRWFARVWVGAPDADAPPHDHAAGSALTLPKLPALSLAGRGRGKAAKAEAASTAASSRSVSLAPEGMSTPVAARAPTKKRSALSTAVVDSEPVPIDVDVDTESVVS
ncbi:hypothetical protein BV25DRAFT_1911020 [Artomyces pyxidatus]|uniref:Uncharacterized protein n=1 Tax=Artomyces pyxidatus TaxID=48021 RepID=A0ACB8THP0_9AGAM|nr:hypothetical protein BV25DRAFT_1911020 [Artomyces pyxidatus]